MEKRYLSWPPSPISGLSLSASGLLALADLSTVAKRTALTGTATWLDILVLVPGIHYQQGAEKLGAPRLTTHTPQALDLHSGTARDVTNTATIHYLQRVGTKQHATILDVSGPHRGMRRKALTLTPDGRAYQRATPASSKVSNVLYLLTPALTIAALVLLVLTQDWYGVGILGALMVSRALNVYIIQQRVKEEPPIPSTPNKHENWWVNLDGQNICLRGLAHDLDAITTGEWMRAKTDIEGYLEAMAKLLVYMVGILSGNMRQTGDIILIILLLSSSGLLALSNAYTNAFNMNGRVSSVTEQTPVQPGDDNRDSRVPLQPRPRYPVANGGGDGDDNDYSNDNGYGDGRGNRNSNDNGYGDGRGNRNRNRNSNRNTYADGNGNRNGKGGEYENGGSSGSDWEKSASDFEKSEAKIVIDSAYPFADDVNYV